MRLFHVLLASLAVTVAGRVAYAEGPVAPQPFLTPAAPPFAAAPPCDPSAPPADSPDYRTIPRALLPRVLRYKEDEPIPFGYELKRRPRWGFVIAGAVTFGATYLPTAFIGGALAGGPDDDGFGLPMIIPFAGPFISIGLERGAKGVLTGLAVVNSVLQIGGAGLFTAGYVMREEYLEQSASRSVRLSPTVLLGPQSAGLRWRF